MQKKWECVECGIEQEVHLIKTFDKDTLHEIFYHRKMIK